MYKFPEEMRKIYESSPLSFVYYQNIDGKAVPILASDGFCRNTGVDRDAVPDWLFRSMLLRMHPDDVGMLSLISDDFLNKRDTYDVVFRIKMDTTDHIPTTVSEASYTLIHALGHWQTMPDGTELAVITYANLTATREAIREKSSDYLLFQRDRFYTDPLTNLPNINYLHEFGNEKINAILSDGDTPNVIYTDIYSMQSYNTQYGFNEGDNLLRLVAETLSHQFPDSLVIKGADDHFIMVTKLDDNEELVRRLREANKIIRTSAYGNTSGIRSGICPITKDVTMSMALDHAKHALKRIESNLTREVAFFSQKKEKSYWQKRYIVENFEKALKNGWIKVFYHALYRMKNQKIAAFEGLARWIDPDRGTISPIDFIPVLLKYHLLYKLDLYMFEQVCKEMKIRSENGLPMVPVSINFSRQDFDHADIVSEMNRIYEKHEMDKYVDKSYFIVEITEQDIAMGADRLREQLQKIRENGFRLWLDDFGSGYSALNVFSRFDFDLIKYDMDLLRHLDDHNGINRIILQAMVSLARQIGIHTLIEGLETEDQLSFVKTLGCELAQGFYYHKPEPLDETLFKKESGNDIRECETAEERLEMNKIFFEENSAIGMATH
ncbi:MAG: EAL domain-containing protein [Clostridia bacterium]|nr:EAL domain-containing protein [Clostridia bacterium]